MKIELRSSRIELFGTLLERLGNRTFPVCRDENVSDVDYATFAFFESYFSNYIVPTVFRPDYIGALRCLSRDRNPEVLVDAMSRLLSFSQLLSHGDFKTMKRRLETSNAFSDDEGLHLRF